MVNEKEVVLALWKKLPLEKRQNEEHAMEFLVFLARSCPEFIRHTCRQGFLHIFETLVAEISFDDCPEENERRR